MPRDFSSQRNKTSVDNEDMGYFLIDQASISLPRSLS